MGNTMPTPGRRRRRNPRKQDEQGEEREEQQREAEAEKLPCFTCEICIEPTPQDKKFKNKKRCSHPFCLDCISKFIDAKTDDNITAVKCPDLNCNKVLDPLSCRPILPARVFNKWCDLLCNATILKCERVYCPYPDCSELVLNECGGRVRKCECPNPNCKRLFCFRCKLPWHAGYRCDESGVTRDSNDLLIGQVVETKQWTRCPGCGHSVELLLGCPIVRCRGWVVVFVTYSLIKRTSNVLPFDNAGAEQPSF
ncbi:PREDICTED: probable E3 ubiquitin-protein ligase RNF217 isoform X2 [Nelumbo nucifera]|uniref:RBR-type E3 ubiquitin transferase n=1 Tax=Nelumbo nucifera TaxID=4432 RepID=A0A1U8AHX3_NELNU|nr:PREDICTED: probable E3 ubiquitin-protein ligase RNF217 isoform X2 [Nelumbo nucifera]